MGTTKSFPLKNGVYIGQILNIAQQNLSAQGYAVQVIPLNDFSATLIVEKDYDGFKKVIGLGVSCKATVSIQNSNMLMVNIDSEWTNKIIALAIGWFFCLIPFITGIVGAVNQNSLPDKVGNALMIATSSC